MHLLELLICYFTEAQDIQLTGTLIVDVEATTGVQVFYSIFPNTGDNITYTVSTMIHMKLV